MPGGGLRILAPISPDFELTGEVPRLDIAPGDSYYVWLFRKAEEEWRHELRMPILQAQVAGRMGVGSEKVAVGFYFFQEGEYENVCYQPHEIDTAMGEARQIGKSLASDHT